MLPKTVAGFLLVVGTILFFLSLFANQGKVDLVGIKLPKVSAKVSQILKIWGVLFLSAGTIMYLLGYGTISLLISPTLTLTPTSISTFIPSPTYTPTLTLTPSQTPSPTQIFTPTPVPTCPAGTEKPIIEHDQEDARIETVKYKINNGEPNLIARNGIITLRQGNILELTELTYFAKTTLYKDQLALEAYYQYGDCKSFYNEDGLFSKGIVLEASGGLLYLDDHWIDQHKNPKHGWEVQQGWNQVLVVLVHYFPGCPPDGCHAVEDRFRIQLFVEP